MYKKLLSLFLCALLCLSGAHATGDAAPAAPAPVTGLAEPVPDIIAPRAALLCAETGQLLLGKDAESPAPPASITKIMTALLVLENCPDLTAATTVSEVAVHSIERGSTHIALDTGEVVTIRDMLGALLVESANDAANVLAEYVGGSLEGFAAMMNEKAAALGCTGTHFANAHGLDDPAHYVTAHDMARITAAAVQYPAFAEYAGASTFTIPVTNKQDEERVFYTKQNMLRKSSKWYDPEVIAGKNGWTTNAHQTLVTVKRHGGVTLIAVVMGESQKADCLADTAAMFEYGFNELHRVELPTDAQAKAAAKTYENTDVDALRAQAVLLPKDKKAADVTLACSGDAAHPSLTASLGGETLTTIPLTLMTAGAPGGEPGDDGGAVPASANAEGGFSILKIAGIAAGVVVALLLILILYRTYRVRRQRRRIRAMRNRNRRY
ncbi:D-alanyl-D-alanine carboxypeptidase [Intestinibacillus massiliensis]|nr:D-alanyl-D-alanine carboxypeptidase [Intestinibacillus massiliensis]